MLFARSRPRGAANFRFWKIGQQTTSKRIRINSHLIKMKKRKSHSLQPKIYGKVRGRYADKSIKKRIERLFLRNIGKVLTREQILQVARDPQTGREPENWHQRLS